MAAVVSFFSFNFAKWLYIKIRFKMQPLDYKQLLIILTAFVCYLIGNNIPNAGNVYLDILVRSSITTVIFVLLLLVLNVSDDINERYKVYKNLFLKIIHHNTK